jgi:regulator of sigma D
MIETNNKTNEDYEHKSFNSYNESTVDKISKGENSVFTKIKLEPVSILDKKIGSLRDIWNGLTRMSINIYKYVKSFFTRKKMREVKDLFIMK